MAFRSRSLARSVAIGGILLLSATSAFAQDTEETVHLEIVVRPRPASPVEGVPSRSLKPSSFNVRLQGKSLNAQVAEGRSQAFPPQLLIFSDNLSTDCLREKDGDAVNGLLAKGWAVRLADSTGRVTSQLTPGVDLSSACSSASSDTHDPIVQLTQMMGRRVVMLLGDPGKKTADAAIRAIPEIYAVDGGVEVKSFTPLLAIPKEGPVAPPDSGEPYTVRCHPVGGRTSPNDLCNQGVSADVKVSGYSHGISHERDSADALHDLLASEDRYYDLTFKAQPSSLKALSLTFHSDASLHVVVTPYTEKHSRAAALVREPLDIRVLLSQR